MSADLILLRDAAEKMRERAEAANEGPWKCYDAKEWYGGGPAWEVDHVPTSGICEGEDVQVAGGADKSDAEHIASWHPAVALAVAHWLDAVRIARPPAQILAASPAIAVARAYLGEQP